MVYDFTTNHKREIILKTEDGIVRNYGDGFIAELPIVFWLAYKQINTSDLFQGNLFNSLDLHRRIRKRNDIPSCSLDDKIDTALSMFERLPRTIGSHHDINYELSMMSLSEFKGPYNEYEIKIRSKSFEIMQDGKPNLSVAPEMLYTFGGCYLELIGDWSEFEYIRETIKYIYGRLKNKV